MSDITLSKAVRSNLLSLQNTADMMATTQNRLATGKKVNSALDNPTNFFTASSLNSRAGDINQLMDGMANAIQTIEAADNGLSAITKTLESMQSTLRQARQDKSFQTESFSLDSDAIKAANTSGGGALTFTGGALGEDSFSVDLRKAVQGSTTAAAKFEPITDNADTGATLSASGAPTATDFSGAATLEFTVQGSGDAGPASVSLAAADFSDDPAAVAADDTLTLVGDLADVTDEELATAINKKLEGNSTVQASVVGGNLTFTDTDTDQVGTAATITVAGVGADAAEEAAELAKIGFDAATDDLSAAGESGAVVREFSLNGQTIQFTSAETTAEEAANSINDQLSDAGVEGVTASVSNGRLVIKGSEDGETAVTLEASTTEGNEGDLAALFGQTADQKVVTAAAETAAGAAVKSVDELVREINSNEDLKGSVRASNDNGNLRIENLSTQGLDVGGVSSDGAVDGMSSVVEDTIGGNSVRSDLANQYNELRDQLDKLADDASFNGINLLRGDKLSITFNEIGTSSLDIQSRIPNEDGEAEDGLSINSSSLGITTNMEAADLDSDASIDTMLADIKTAVNTVRSQSSAFGSSLSIVENRQDFSKNMINTLETGAANLTLADSNEEAANLLALQTRQQLSSTALSMASQQDQSVLRLF